MSQIWRTVRVFISSTFRDMHAERDHLVRFIFPRLREQLLKRRIHLVDVDLRWGVTSEQDALKICREIIDECRPRFICILGGRYGSTLVEEGLSITAAEIKYAVFDQLDKKEYRYFYFRDPQVTNLIPEADARPGGYREFPLLDEIVQFGRDQAEVLARQRIKKLKNLKEAIIDAGFEPFVYPARWDGAARHFVDLEAFGERVYTDLLESVNDELGTITSITVDEFTEENAAMEAFIEEQMKYFVVGSRQALLDEMTAFAEGEGIPNILVLTGQSGLGKSALFGKLYQDYVKNHPDEIIIPHFVGASAGSTDLRRTLRRFCHKLSQSTDYQEEIPQDVTELLLLFAKVLKQASTSRHIVLLIDAINQFDSTDSAHTMYWLPTELPCGVRVIFSSLEHPALESLRNRREPIRETELLSLNKADGRAIVEGFLDLYQKKLSKEQLDTLLEKSESGRPLYLLVALEELRTLGTYEEITNHIHALPDELTAMFLWILKERLSNDPGFRDQDGRFIGTELVRKFVSCLGVSQHGLSQVELVDLIDPGDPLGNVAALQRLLRPYLMLRGELLDFYHNQLRQSVESEYLDEEQERLATHNVLAEYFHRKADPYGNQNWELNARHLTELLFHLAHGGQDSELHKLLSQLSYLAARVATGQVYEQIADYSLAGSTLPFALVEWHDFLQKHTQRLTKHPTMLVALANHEGFEKARKQATTILWSQPWLRTSPEQMPVPENANFNDGLRIEVTGNFEFPWGRVMAMAPQRELVFCVERLGALRVFDLHAMQHTEAVLSIRRERSMVLVCAPDATGLAIFYESGEAELYRCIFGLNRWPVRLELVLKFRFYMPECKDPVVTWHEDACWFQSKANSLANISILNPIISEDYLPVDESGELSALVFGEEYRLIALRLVRDTLLLVDDAPPLRRPDADVSSACACGRQSVAVSFTDGDLVIYETASGLIPKTKVRAGVIRGALGWDGSRLLWVAEGSGFTAWRPEQNSPIHVQDNQEVFPRHMHILPQRWLYCYDGTTLLVTTHSIVAFYLLEGNGAADGRLEELFGGPIWRAVLKQEEDQWLLEGRSLRKVLLGHGVMGRLYCARDGKDRFFATSGYGPGLVLDLATLRSASLQDCPPGINQAVGEPEGGCWFTDRAGDIYYASAKGQCQCLASINLTDVHGAQLANCGDFLVWYGYSSRFFPDTGADAARTFVFFRKYYDIAHRLERLGDQFRHPSEGYLLAICYAEATKQLVTLWEMPIAGVATYRLKVGPVKEFIAWRFKETEVKGLGLNRFLQADLSADAQLLGVLNYAGEFSCLNIIDGRVVTTLIGSAPFTRVATGADGPQFWLVEAQKRVYACSLIERKI